jgi:nicotinate phosphoribosyltransferase
MTILHTDAYKRSMGEYGFPLREEQFYYTHRKGGWAYLPVDVEGYLKPHIPMHGFKASEENRWASENGYHAGPALQSAMFGAVEIRALRPGSWFYNTEPVFSVRGPSALVSYLEPVAIQLNYLIQATTHLMRGGNLPKKVTCISERNIWEQALHYSRRDPMAVGPKPVLASTEYYDFIAAKAKGLLEAVGGDPNRLFEVGMRAASCQEQHEIALSALKSVGINRTSNLGAAKKMGMIPVGTMGHEHPKRMGSSYEAFVSMRDRSTGMVFYLPDTWDAMLEGLPAAFKALRERPERNAGIRLDADKGMLEQYLYVVSKSRELGLEPVLALESGWDLTKTLQFEDIRKILGWSKDKQIYGLGGYFVNSGWDDIPTRDGVAAVYKLCMSNGVARCKISEPGKESIPGSPVLWRSRITSGDYNPRIPVGWVAQEGENWTPPFPSYKPSEESVEYFPSEMERFANCRIGYSPATEALIRENHVLKDRNILAFGGQYASR